MDTNSDNEEPGQHFSWYSSQASDYMRKQGYDFTLGEGLRFGQGARVPPRPTYVPKGKTDTYYSHRRGLGYVSSSDDEYCWQIINQLTTENGYSSDSSTWDSDVSIGERFKSLMSNMATVNPSTAEEDDHLTTWEDPWMHYMNIQYGDRFEQKEPPMEDKVVQINMGDEINPKPIFISDDLSTDEREELIALVREYIDVFVGITKICQDLNQM